MTFNIFNNISKFINTLTFKSLDHSTKLFLMCHYYITSSFARSFSFFIIFEKNAFFNERTHSLTFFIPISHIRYIYEHLLIHSPN